MIAAEADKELQMGSLNLDQEHTYTYFYIPPSLQRLLYPHCQRLLLMMRF